MRNAILRFLLIAGVLLVLPHHSAEADNKGKAVKLMAQGDKKLALGDRLMKRGKRAKSKRAYRQALALYKKANRSFPSPKIYVPMAIAEQKLGRYLSAHNHYLRFLNESESVSDALAKVVQKGLKDVRGHLAGLDLTVSDDAIVRVDGEDVETGDEPHYLAAGTHALSVELTGHKPYSAEIVLKKGEVESMTIELEKKPVLVVLKKDEPPAILESPISAPPSRLPLQLAVAMTGTMLLGATFASEISSVNLSRSEDEAKSDATRDKAAKKSKTYLLASRVLIGGAVVAGGYGLLYYYTSYRSDRAKQERNALRVIPKATSEELGVAIVGSF